MKKEYCLGCNKLVVPIIVEEERLYTFAGRVFKFQEQSAKCEACGCEFITQETHTENIRRLKDASSMPIEYVGGGDYEETAE